MPYLLKRVFLTIIIISIVQDASLCLAPPGGWHISDIANDNQIIIRASEKVLAEIQEFSKTQYKTDTYDITLQCKATRTWPILKAQPVEVVISSLLDKNTYTKIVFHPVTNTVIEWKFSNKGKIIDRLDAPRISKYEKRNIEVQTVSENTRKVIITEGFDTFEIITEIVLKLSPHLRVMGAVKRETLPFENMAYTFLGVREDSGYVDFLTLIYPQEQNIFAAMIIHPDKQDPDNQFFDAFHKHFTSPDIFSKTYLTIENDEIMLVVDDGVSVYKLNYKFVWHPLAELISDKALEQLFRRKKDVGHPVKRKEISNIDVIKVLKKQGTIDINRKNHWHLFVTPVLSIETPFLSSIGFDAEDIKKQYDAVIRANAHIHAVILDPNEWLMLKNSHTQRIIMKYFPEDGIADYFALVLMSYDDLKRWFDSTAEPLFGIVYNQIEKDTHTQKYIFKEDAHIMFFRMPEDVDERQRWLEASKKFKNSIKLSPDERDYIQIGKHLDEFLQYVKKYRVPMQCMDTAVEEISHSRGGASLIRLLQEELEAARGRRRIENVSELIDDLEKLANKLLETSQ